MIETDLALNYGVLGLWVIYMIYEKKRSEEILKKSEQVIINNTNALKQIKKNYS